MPLPALKIAPDAACPSRLSEEAGEVQPDGEVATEAIPLTLDVLLHPQEDD